MKLEQSKRSWLLIRLVIWALELFGYMVWHNSPQHTYFIARKDARPNDFDFDLSKPIPLFVK